MIKLIVLSVLMNAGDSNICATVPTEMENLTGKIYAGRKRSGKGQKGRRRGGGGLR